MLPPIRALFVLALDGVFSSRVQPCMGVHPHPASPIEGEEFFCAGLRGKEVGEELEHRRPEGDQAFDERGVSRGGCRAAGHGILLWRGAAAFTRRSPWDGHEKAPGRHLPRAQFRDSISSVCLCYVPEFVKDWGRDGEAVQALTLPPLCERRAPPLSPPGRGANVIKSPHRPPRFRRRGFRGRLVCGGSCPGRASRRRGRAFRRL